MQASQTRPRQRQLEIRVLGARGGGCVSLGLCDARCQDCWPGPTRQGHEPFISEKKNIFPSSSSPLRLIAECGLARLLIIENLVDFDSVLALSNGSL